jgi:hypothetical protein
MHAIVCDGLCRNAAFDVRASCFQALPPCCLMSRGVWRLLPPDPPSALPTADGLPDREYIMKKKKGGPAARLSFRRSQVIDFRRNYPLESEATALGEGCADAIVNASLASFSGRRTRRAHMRRSRPVRIGNARRYTGIRPGLRHHRRRQSRDADGSQDHFQVRIHCRRLNLFCSRPSNNPLAAPNKAASGSRIHARNIEFMQI